VTTNPSTPPGDATLSVGRAADVLGVHPNTIRTWSEQGRLRYYRINARGDRRFRMGDLRRFLAEAGRDSEARIERATRREAAIQRRASGARAAAGPPLPEGVTNDATGSFEQLTLGFGFAGER
jgi:excisionase family DNA binding protein